jgi:hypothetical protein
VVSVSNQSRAALTASFVFAKKSGGDSVESGAAMKNSGELKGDVREVPQNVVHAGSESFGGASTARQRPGNPEQGSE